MEMGFRGWDCTREHYVAKLSPDVIHTFAGMTYDHTVRLTIWTSDSCSAYTDHIVTSIPKPQANFEYSPQPAKRNRSISPIFHKRMVAEA